MTEGPSYVCVGCAARSPAVETEYTLISSRFGWRLTRRVKNGQLHLDWRCPACWQRFKQERAMAMTPTEGVPIVETPDDPPSSRRDPESTGPGSSRRRR